MSKRRARPRTWRPQQVATVEWIGGIFPLPAYVTGEGEPYRPEILMWLSGDGAILGSDIDRPGVVLAGAANSLKQTIKEPIYGRPHRPGRVRVASAELAEVLRAGNPDIDIVCAPTPELDEVRQHMQKDFAAADDDEQSLLADGRTAPVLASFFSAAAALFRIKPWEVVPADEHLLAITLAEYGLFDAPLAIIGQMKRSFGFILFQTIEAYEAYLVAADLVDAGEEPKMPPHFTLNYERGADLPTTIRKEIYEHQWEVAGSDAYPQLTAYDEDMMLHLLSDDDVIMAEAIARGLTTVIAETQELQRPWVGGEPVSRTMMVPTAAGDMEITVVAPYAQGARAFDPSVDILAELVEVSRGGVILDENRFRALENELLRRFAASPEAGTLSEMGACSLVMGLALDYLGRSIVEVGSTRLQRLLFEFFPRKVSIQADKAHSIIAELRAFYHFLKREYGFKKADGCMRILGGNAAGRFEAALADPNNFSPVKSILMAGAEAGYDMESKEGIEAFMEATRNIPAPPPIPGSFATPYAAKKAANAKKSKRKTARASRKKNR
ncbi:MAG TPA: hypothetical protein DDX99_03025 [Desulfofustis sp.]|nr:hypothetical protein [Desulfofustis sp.]